MIDAQNLEQGSPEWLAVRLGKVTASRVSDVIAKTKSGPSASRANYSAELICERLTGDAADRFTNPAMAWGRAMEDEARAAYEFDRGIVVQSVGFVPHPAIEMTGASPDGFVGDDGLVEIKCPNSATHIDTLRNGKVPEKYVTQMQWQMACTGRAWCDFVSYDPRLPQSMRMFIKRIDRDDKRIAELETDVSAFLKEVSDAVAELKLTYEMKEAA